MGHALKRGNAAAYRSPASNTNNSHSATIKQPRYHQEIDSGYLAAMQKRVDDAKPEGFKLTPISQPGW
jgi:hypothetical protein